MIAWPNAVERTPVERPCLHACVLGPPPLTAIVSRLRTLP